MREVVFGLPAASTLAEMAGHAGARRILIMASGTLRRKTAEIANIQDALGHRVVAILDGIPAHSPRSAVIAATAIARQADVDLIITVGGGSVTDAGKAVRLCLANDIQESAALDALRVCKDARGAAQLPACKPPTIAQIAVPTTLSAGEFSAIAGLTDERSRTKDLFRHPDMVLTAVVLDPAITRHTPEDLFLSTGVRAIDHCVEGICSPRSHPYADAQALRGLALLAAGLPRIKENPGDLDARLNCLLGAWLSMAPVSCGVPMGASHGIGYVLGAAHGVAHGHTSCIMLPAVLRWNQSANASRQAEVAAALGAPGATPDSLLETLIARLGMPSRLSTVGITPQHFPCIAEQAMDTPWVPCNPRPIRGPEDVQEILAMAA